MSRDDSADPGSAARPTRRRLLASLSAVATTALAGCGYRAGAGEFDWEESVGPSSASPFGSERTWLGDGERLIAVRNRDGRTFDHDAGRWIDREDARVSAYDATGDRVRAATVDEQFDGDPAMDASAVYLPLADGGVAAVARLTGDASSTATGTVTTDGAAWTSPRTDDALDLTAGDSLVVGHAGSALHAFDADTGAERFATSLEDPIRTTVVAADRVWAATDGGGLSGFDPDGERRVDADLPGPAAWLVPAGSAVLVGASGSLRALEADGGTRWTRDVAVDTEPPQVVDDRWFHLGGGRLRAGGLADGDPLWERDAPFDGPFVADADGLYGPRSVTEGYETECRLVGIGTDGEERWRVRPVDDVDCGSDPFRVDGRLVLVDDGHLYAFRLEPEPRWTLF